jgi:hypothetical protein
VAAYLNGTSEALDLTGQQQQVGAIDVGVWLLAALSMWCTLVGFANAMTHTENMLSCAACFTAVLLSKQALQQQRPVLTGCAAVACIMALVSLVEGSTSAGTVLAQTEGEGAEPSSRLSDLDAIFDDCRMSQDECASISAFSIGHPDDTDGA